MNLGSRTMACDGRLYFLRRRQANPGIIEVTDRYIAQGWLAHSHTSDGVEVYRVTPTCPRYIKESPRDDQYLKALVEDAATAAYEERFKDLRAIGFDLARLLKSAGFGATLFAELMDTIARKAGQARGEPLYSERVRLALRELALEEFRENETLVS